MVEVSVYQHLDQTFKDLDQLDDFDEAKPEAEADEESQSSSPELKGEENTQRRKIWKDGNEEERSLKFFQSERIKRLFLILIVNVIHC